MTQVIKGNKEGTQVIPFVCSLTAEDVVIPD